MSKYGVFLVFFPHIDTEYGNLLLKSPYSVQILQNIEPESPYLNSSQVVCRKIYGNLGLIYCRNYYRPNFLQIDRFLRFQMRTNCYETSPILLFFVWYTWFHGTIILIGITCKKISCYMRNSICSWLIVDNAKILASYVKHFWIFPR